MIIALKIQSLQFKDSLCKDVNKVEKGMIRNMTKTHLLHSNLDLYLPLISLILASGVLAQGLRQNSIHDRFIIHCPFQRPFRRLFL